MADDTTGKWEGWSLYDEVKRRIYHKNEVAAEVLKRITIDYSNRRAPRDNSELSGVVLDLWFELFPKSGYPKQARYNELSEEKYRECYKLNKSGEFKQEAAYEKLILLRCLIEDLGITRFETKRADPADEMMSELEESE